MTVITRASMFDQLRSPEACQREAAWREFHDRYAPVIAAFARGCGANTTDVDDIVQDVITGFLSVSGEFAYDPRKGRFRGWLKTCAVRAAVRRAGQAARFAGVLLADLPDAQAALEPVWDDAWERQLVARALEQLRSEAGASAGFQAFEQHGLLGQPASVVAAGLGVSVEVVHQSKTRWLRRLREVVSQLRGQEP